MRFHTSNIDKKASMKAVRLACAGLAAVMALTLAACGGSGSGGAADDCTVEHDLEARDYSEYMTLGQYSGMEIPVETSLRVTDAQVQEQIDAVISSMTTQERIEEGVTAEGDTIDMDFTGYQNGEPFEGGAAQGYQYTIGSGQFIEDLDTQLVGLTVGETYNLDCTFPEDYHSAVLAGQTVTFEVKVNAIMGDDVIPEWTDELVSEYSGGEYTTTADYEAYVRESLEDQASSSQRTEYIENLWTAVLDNCTFESIPEDEVAEAEAYYYDNVVAYYTDFASQYDTDLAGILEMFGTTEDDLHEYAHSMAENEVRSFMVANMICLAEDIELTEEAYQEQMGEDATTYGYENFEAFEAESGRAYLTDTYKYTLVLTWLQEHNTMVEAAAEEPETVMETPAA